MDALVKKKVKESKYSSHIFSCLLNNLVIRTNIKFDRFNNLEEDTIYKVIFEDNINRQFITFIAKEINFIGRNELLINKNDIEIKLNNNLLLYDVIKINSLKQKKKYKEAFNKDFFIEYPFFDSDILNKISNLIRSGSREDNSFEKKVKDFIKEKKLKFEYVGDGRFFIGYKNPDFIDKTNRKIIEVYSSYFKILSFGSCENYENERGSFFKKQGYSTLFLDEHDLEKDYKKKILEFVNP